MSSVFPNSYDDATLYKIEHSGRVSEPIFQVICGFFCAIALLAFASRMIIRLTLRRRLNTDDYLLIFGAAALIAATVIIYRFSHLIYILNILQYDHAVIPTLSDLQAIGNAQGIQYSSIAMMWTATCAVKFCFLTTCKALIAKVSFRITVWYWTVVFLSIITWGFATTVSFMICPYSGQALIQHCTPETPYEKTMALTNLVTCLDVVTDLMIVAIPIWILRHVRIKLKQKCAIGIFLCLSIVMIIVTITRAAASYHDGYWDLTWEFLVLYLESCIAIVMASVVAFRSVFVEKSRKRERTRIQMLSSPGSVALPRHPENSRGRLGKTRVRVTEDIEDDIFGPGRTTYLSTTPQEGSKIKGLWTFIEGHRTQTRIESSDGSAEENGFQDHNSDTWLEDSDEVVHVDIRQV